MPIGKRDDVVIRYGGDDTGFRKATKRVKNAGKKVSDVFAKLGQVSAGVSAFISGAGVALTAFAKSALSSADALEKTADKIGIGIEDLQRFRIAGERAGISTGTMDTALQRFSRRIGEVLDGTGVLKKDIDRLGISLRYGKGNVRSLRDIFLDYADAVAAATSKQEQLRLSVVAFDTEAAGMVNLMREGAEELRNAFNAADELGLVMSEKLIRESSALNQLWEDFNTKISIRFRKALLGVVTSLGLLEGKYKTSKAALGALSIEEERLKGLYEDFTNTLWPNMRLWYLRQISVTKERIRGIKEQIDALERLEKAERALSNIPKFDEEDEKKAKKKKTARSKGGGGASRAGGGAASEEDLTYQQENIRDFQLYKRGEITRGEWVKREEERNPFYNPESPFNKDFTRKTREEDPLKTGKPPTEKDLRQQIKNASPYIGDQIPLVIDVRKMIEEQLKDPFDATVNMRIAGGIDSYFSDAAATEGAGPTPVTGGGQ